MTLKEKYQQASSAYYTLERNVRSKKEERIEKEVKPILEKASQLQRQIANEVDEEFKSELYRLQELVNAAKADLDADNIVKSKGGWHPEGTVVFKWEHQRWGRKQKLTDKRGVVAIYDGTQDIKFPQYNKPNQGDFIVIFLKKDGTPGRLFERISSYHQNNEGRVNYPAGWFPEGIDPNKIVDTNEN